jgi:hypothetical protein
MVVGGNPGLLHRSLSTEHLILVFPTESLGIEY